jgi:hypothetical protein
MYALVYKLYHEGVCRRCTLGKQTIVQSVTIDPSMILDLVHLEEAQELEATMTMSPTCI